MHTDPLLDLFELGCEAVGAGRLDEARSTFDRALQLAVEGGVVDDVLPALRFVGIVARRQRRYADAEASFQRGVAVAGRTTDAWWLGWFHLELASLFIDQRNLARAGLHQRMSLELLRQAAAHVERLEQGTPEERALAEDRRDDPDGPHALLQEAVEQLAFIESERAGSPFALTPVRPA